jgi:hypothetical protein
MATKTSSPPEEPPGVLAVKSTGCSFDPKCCVTDSGRNKHWVTLLQAEEHPRIARLAPLNSRLDFKRQAIPAVGKNLSWLSTLSLGDETVQRISPFARFLPFGQIVLPEGTVKILPLSRWFWFRHPAPAITTAVLAASGSQRRHILGDSTLPESPILSRMPTGWQLPSLPRHHRFCHQNLVFFFRVAFVCALQIHSSRTGICVLGPFACQSTKNRHCHNSECNHVRGRP